MPNSTPRPFVLCLLALTLLVPIFSPAPAAAASWEEGGPAAGFFGRFWGAVSAIWSNEGCMIDGNGRCLERQSAVTEDPNRGLVLSNVGCIIDPDGRCRDNSVATASVGCILDPNGSCRQ